MKTIISCSYGKDSLATVILAHRKGIHIDDVICSEVMFDENTSAFLPEQRDFIYNIAIPKLESWGFKCTMAKSHRTAKDIMMHVRGEKSKYKGCYVGWPVVTQKCDLQQPLKVSPIKKYIRETYGSEFVEYIGIAADEIKRQEQLNDRKRSMLVEYGITECQAYEMCKEEGLLSPIYKSKSRDGCFFCPYAGMKNLRYLAATYPWLLDKMLTLDAEMRPKIKPKGCYLFNQTLPRAVERIKQEAKQLNFDFSN